MIKKYVVRDEQTRLLAVVLVLDTNLVIAHGTNVGTFGYVWDGPPSLKNVLGKVTRSSAKQAACNFASNVTKGSKPIARQFIERVWPYFVNMLRAEQMLEVRA